MADKPAKSSNIPTFTREQLVKSKKYAARRDLLNVLLTADGRYTAEEVETLIKGYDKKAVK